MKPQSLVTLSLMSSAQTIPHSSTGRTLKRQAAELHDAYDFVIVGGGTTGISVADRLTGVPREFVTVIHSRNTANHCTESVFVVEYDGIEYAAGRFDLPKLVWSESGGYANRWELTLTPNPELGNTTAYVIVGGVVSGSSAVKGMVFNRKSRYDYDAWQQL